MVNANQAPPGWVKILLRTVGTVNAVAVLLGMSTLEPVYRVLTRRHFDCHIIPHCRLVLATVTAVELAFASVLLATAIRFIQARLSAANLYSLAVMMLLAYFVAVDQLARTGGGIALSVAAATNVAGYVTGIFGELPFLPFPHPPPFLYPAGSVVLVQLLKWRYGIGRLRSEHSGDRNAAFGTTST
jgi:hypothetical protein